MTQMTHSRKHSYLSSVLALSLVLTLLLPQQSWAQNKGGGNNDIVQKSVNDIVTVASLGAAGAVLGLSTLSFVDEPEDHLKNIVVGGALGIIIGVGVVAYNQANQSQQYYRESVFRPIEDSSDFSTRERLSWHESSFEKSQKDSFGKNLEDSPSLTYNISF